MEYGNGLRHHQGDEEVSKKNPAQRSVYIHEEEWQIAKEVAYRRRMSVSALLCALLRQNAVEFGMGSKTGEDLSKKGRGPRPVKGMGVDGSWIEIRLPKGEEAGKLVFHDSAGGASSRRQPRQGIRRHQVVGRDG